MGKSKFVLIDANDGHQISSSRFDKYGSEEGAMRHIAIVRDRWHEYATQRGWNLVIEAR